MNKPTTGRLDGDALNLSVDLLEDFKALLPQLFDLSEDAVVIVDVNDAVVYVNPQFLQLAGITSAQILGEDFTAICTEHAPIRIFGKVTQKVVSTKKTTTISRLINPIKSHYEFATISPVLSQQQLVIGAMLVTKQARIERTLADQELRENAAYQQTMMDSIPFMIWLKNNQSRLLAANRAFAKTTGASDPKELVGKTDFDIWPHHLAKDYVADDMKVLESGEQVSLVEKVKSKNGSADWVETYKAPVVVDGKVIGTIGYARDISEEKQLLSTINKQDLQFTSLLQNLPLAVVRYDTACKRTFINTAHGKEDSQTLLGATPEEVWSPNIKNMTAESYQEKLMHVLFHGETETFEMHCDIDGGVCVNMVTLLPEFDQYHQVVGAIAIANDVTEISKYRHDLEHMAYHDVLTLLPNRAFLNQQLHLAAKRDARFGLMFMDLDFFKEINDTLGHEVGDGLLVDVAKRISASVRSHDVVARIGGDEFAILIPDLREDAGLTRLAAKIAGKLAAPFNIEGINFFVTASIGIACYPEDSEEVEDLIKYADTAMYEAKKQGRNNYQFYSPDMTEQAMEHLAIATALRYAIQKDELFLLYQPKVDIATGKIQGAEALLRWHGRVLGQIQPDKFIPIAEESGLIFDIGVWVLKTACEVAVQLNKRRAEPLNIAVNVSSKELSGNDYIKNLQLCLAETGCRPEWLTLELTESLLLQDTGKALQTLIAIDEMGITLSIDDFGTGYSALAYLSKFPIRQVKIDRSFVRDICNTESAATLIKAIIAMTQSLGKQLVAEGIETKAQANLLKSFGCNEAQGYLYGQPIEYSALVHMVAQQKMQ